MYQDYRARNSIHSFTSCDNHCDFGPKQAGKEQLKDELVVLNEDMSTGLVRTIAEVRQSALKEFYLEIEMDDDQMTKINAVIPEGIKLQKIATAVTIALFSE